MSRSRDKLIQTAMRVLAQNPQATLEQIAEAADMTRTTLFRHFRTRQKLICALSLESYRRCCTEAMDPILATSVPPEEKLRQIVNALIPLGAAFHFLSYEPYHSSDPDIERMCNSYLERWRVLVTALNAEGLIASDIPVVWVTTLLDMLVFGAWESIHRGDLAPNTAGELVVRTFFRGVRS